MTERTRLYYAGVGAVAMVAIIGVLALSVATFRGTFTPKVVVSVDTDRAGLLMETQNRVVLDGVNVGSVLSVEPRGDGARLRLALAPDRARAIPNDVIPSIDASTLFGPKVVNLARPRSIDHYLPISDGATLVAQRKAPEVNNVFDQLIRILDTVDPAQLSSVLGETAHALRGRGSRTGELIDQLDDLIVRFNPSLPTLRNDLERAAPVLNTYATATPDLVQTLSNLTATGQTLVAKNTEIDALLRETTALSDNSRTFLATNEHALGRTLDTLRPTSHLLAAYSPMFPCFFKGLDRNRQLLEKVMGGNGHSAGVSLALIPGDTPYKAPRDLPAVAADSGPSCANLPFTQIPAPYYPSRTGTNPKSPANDGLAVGEPLSSYLFGPQSPFRPAGGN